ncbi:hypothetical protein [Paenibacillus sp. 1001270B_150601_E10]|uniref:hypothetical protein n=1 Tax=Paenibacillus sp. 1001270B_150601_E10 TaxID=2787079 RepID=UPI00189FFB2A|nr:hypothetical protein [Paenibacillus sp. 1001270B_150601_E10]
MKVHCEKGGLCSCRTSVWRNVKPLVNDWDPLGLLALGAPDDEYDCLTSFLTNFMEQNEEWEAAQLQQELEHFVETHFGIGPSMMKADRRTLWQSQFAAFSSKLWMLRDSLISLAKSQVEESPRLDHGPSS